MIYITICALCFAAFCMIAAAGRLSRVQALALIEAARVMESRPPASWPRVHVGGGQTFALLPEDAAQHGVVNGQEMDLAELADLLIKCDEEYWERFGA